jgi:hypothetical protein
MERLLGRSVSLAGNNCRKRVMLHDCMRKQSNFNLNSEAINISTERRAR